MRVTEMVELVDGIVKLRLIFPFLVGLLAVIHSVYAFSVHAG